MKQINIKPCLQAIYSNWLWVSVLFLPLQSEKLSMDQNVFILIFLSKKSLDPISINHFETMKLDISNSIYYDYNKKKHEGKVAVAQRRGMTKNTTELFDIHFIQGKL